MAKATKAIKVHKENRMGLKAHRAIKVRKENRMALKAHRAIKERPERTECKATKENKGSRETQLRYKPRKPQLS